MIGSETSTARVMRRFCRETRSPLLCSVLLVSLFPHCTESQDFDKRPYEIWCIRSDGTEIKKVASHSPTSVDRPVWSPDGNELMYSLIKPGFHLYRQRLDASTHHLVEGNFPVSWPQAVSWSAGNLLAFSAKGEGATSERDIYIMSPHSGDLRNLTNTPDRPDWQPSWSPDGKKIAFSSWNEPPTDIGSLDIFVTPYDEFEPVNVTRSSSHERRPSWSPDGLQLAFESDRNGNSDIFIAQDFDSEPIDLTNHESQDWAPTWSPDGNRLAFTSDRDGNWEIYIVDVDGSNLVRVTHNEADDQSPSWAPDGQRIAFMSNRTENSIDMWLAWLAGLLR